MTPTEKRIAADLLKEIDHTKTEPRYRAGAIAEYQAFLTSCLIAATLAGKAPKNAQIQITLSPAHISPTQ